MTTRFELVDEGFADPCLTTWPRHHIWSEYFHSIWSGRRGSNSLPPPWQGGALPDELRPHIRGTGVILVLLKGGASDRNRTNDTGIFSPLLYRLSYRGAPDDDYYTRNSGFVKRKLQIFLKKIRLFLKKAFERGIL